MYVQLRQIELKAVSCDGEEETATEDHGATVASGAAASARWALRIARDS